MGTSLSRWAGAALALPGLLAGCWPLGQLPCQPTERVLALPAPYNQFFGSLAACNGTTGLPVAASSSTGLTDSFGGDCVSVGPAYDGEASTSCLVVRHEQRSLSSYASLYGYYFTTRVEQFAEGPRLRIRDQSAASGAPLTELTYRFADGQTEATYLDAASGTTLPFAQLPVVTELRNLQSGSRTYAQVWRITNPLNAAQGRATAATVFFVDRDYGLIRFDQRDGTRWTLAR